jgi:hypothetical protein
MIKNSTADGDRPDENSLRIQEYLENKLSPEMKEAFKRELGENDELRLQYIDALMKRAKTGVEDGNEETEAAGGHVQTMEEYGYGEEGHGEEGHVEADGGHIEADMPLQDWETEAGGGGSGRGFLGSGWMVAAAALLVIIAGVVLFLLIKRQAFWDKTVAAGGKDTTKLLSGASGADSAAGGSGQGAAAGSGGAAGAGAAGGSQGAAAGAKPAAGVTGSQTGGAPGAADSLYTRLYKPYARGDDPMAVRKYYGEYRAGNYTAVLAEGDSITIGLGQQMVLNRDYMRLYVGLSYLATGDASKAVTELEGVVLRTKPGNILYETALWYSALAWLRRSDVDAAEAKKKSIECARIVLHGYSRYVGPAGELIRALK